MNSASSRKKADDTHCRNYSLTILFIWLSEQWEWQGRLFNRIKEAAVFVSMDFQRLHMQRFAVQSCLNLWRNEMGTALLLWTRLPLPTRCCSPRIFMFYHCYSRWRWDRVKHPEPPDENKDTNVSRMARAPPRRPGSFRSWTINETGNCHLQQLVTAKLLATSRLSMWGVSLNSEVPNWTIPIRNALYSWSAPLGNRPPVIDSSRASFSIVKHINIYSL